MNDTLVIIGGGSSIKDFDLHKLDNLFTFGLNYVCHFYEPTAIIWIDRNFYKDNRQMIDNKNSIKITRDSRDVPVNILQLSASKKYYGSRGLIFGLYHPYLVGLFALSLGIALHFKEIYLLGYDGQFLNDKSHFHNIIHRGMQNEVAYLKGNKYFEAYKDDLTKIYNVSPNSAIHTFPKITYDEFCKIIDKNAINQQDAKKWLITQIYDNSKDYTIKT